MRTAPGTRRLGLLAGLLIGVGLLAWLGSVNLASLAWSHQLLAGARPADFPGVVLRAGGGADNPLGRAALERGPPNPLFPAETNRQRAMLALDAGDADGAAADLARALT